MSTHVFGLTVDRAVTLEDEASHVVVVDKRGRVIMRPQERRPSS